MLKYFMNKNYTLRQMLITLFLLSTTVLTAASEQENKDAALAHQPMQFLINVGTTAGNMRFLKVDIALDYASPEAAKRFAKIKPTLSHRILLTLSSLEHEALLTNKGKRVIQEYIRSDLNSILGETSSTGIKDVYFMEFLIQ